MTKVKIQKIEPKENLEVGSVVKFTGDYDILYIVSSNCDLVNLVTGEILEDGDCLEDLERKLQMSYDFYEIIEEIEIKITKRNAKVL